MAWKTACVMVLALCALACSNDDGGGAGDGASTGDGAGDGSTAGDSAGADGAQDAADGDTSTGDGVTGDGTSAAEDGDMGTGMAGAGADEPAVSGGGDAPAEAALPFEEAAALIDAYATAHPGQDGDVNAKTPAQLEGDPEGQAILGLCGEGARPIVPALAWEYGGSDHAFVDPGAAALVYCVYTPVVPNSEHWQYDADADHVTVDVWVLYPDDNPCNDESGADQVAACIGDNSNFEILVDLASLRDGHDVGLELSEASTDLMLLMPDGTRVMLWHDA